MPQSFFTVDFNWLRWLRRRTLGAKGTKIFLYCCLVLTAVSAGLEAFAACSELVGQAFSHHPYLICIGGICALVSAIGNGVFFVGPIKNFLQALEKQTLNPLDNLGENRTKFLNFITLYAPIAAILICGFLSAMATIVMINSISFPLPLAVSIAVSLCSILINVCGQLQEFLHSLSIKPVVNYPPENKFLQKRFFEKLNPAAILAAGNALGAALIFTIGLYPVICHIVSFVVVFAVVFSVCECLNYLLYRYGLKSAHSHSLIFAVSIGASLLCWLFPALHSSFFGITLSNSAKLICSLAFALLAGFITEYYFLYPELHNFFLFEKNSWPSFSWKHSIALFGITCIALVAAVIVSACLISTNFGLAGILIQAGHIASGSAILDIFDIIAIVIGVMTFFAAGVAAWQKLRDIEIPGMLGPWHGYNKSQLPPKSPIKHPVSGRALSDESDKDTQAGISNEDQLRNTGMLLDGSNEEAQRDNDENIDAVIQHTSILTPSNPLTPGTRHSTSCTLDGICESGNNLPTI